MLLIHLATIYFLMTLDLLGLTLVSFLHQSITCETMAFSIVSTYCFLVKKAHCDELDASTYFCFFTIIEMFTEFVLSTLPNALILTTFFLTTTFKKIPLQANFSLDYTLFTRSSLVFNPWMKVC